MGRHAGSVREAPAPTPVETVPAGGEAVAQERPDRWTRVRRALTGIRARLLIRYVLLLALTLFASILVVRQVLLNRVDHRIDERLTHEVQEVQSVAAMKDPETGEPYGAHLRTFFHDFLPTDPPEPAETDFTFVGGLPYMREVGDSSVARPLEFEVGAALGWGTLDRQARGSLTTADGTYEYLAAPITVGGATKGVYAVALFRAAELQEVTDAVEAATGVALIALLVGSILAWGVASRVLKPVAAVTETARSISGSDLSRRVPVRGDDEIARLAATFNDVLDRLEAAFVAQRAFLDDAGHELRTPITIVTGQLELLQDDPARREETLALVMDELDRMTRIVNDLLLLAKAQRSDFLRLDTVDVGTLTDEVLAKASTLGERRWEREAAGRGVIVADRQRLTEALMQLADNAVKHTTGGATIAIGSSVSGAEARFWVRDEGAGIAPAEQERIFARFARGSDGRRGEGAGLGLAIVRAIAEAHHGSVSVRSAPGE
ncbi:MAG: sensor histidine kinase, partial [Planctomycetaceae bacterium]